MPDPAVGPDMTTELPCRRSAFEHSGELRAADTGHHSGGAHGAGADTDLDDVRPGFQQIPGALRRHHVSRRQRQTQVQCRDRLDRVQGLDLVSVCGVDDQHVDAGFGERSGLSAHVAVDADGRADPQPARAIGGRGVDTGADSPGAA